MQKYIRANAGVKIEVFVDRELAFNVTKHALAPISIKHIPARDVSSWAQQEGFQAEKLPMLITSDPLAKFYSALPLDCFQLEG